MSFDLIATAPMGLESVVAYEVRKLGYEPAVENGRVVWTADELALCRANLWLRCSDRVLVRLGQFPGDTFDALFEGTRALPWEDWLPADAAMVVNGRSVRSQLSSVPACQAVVKKAIVERLKQRYPQEWFPETGPRYTIEVALLKDMATLTLDSSGPGLHKRGYRRLSTEAPLKETLAAALIQLCRWYPDRPLLDPFCGSGTIPIEAALIGHNIAPGLHREFAAESWPRLPATLWQAARDEAHDRIDYDAALQIAGSDVDPAAISLAEYHARRAGVGQSISFRQVDIAGAGSDLDHGFLICNPPYGERQGDAAGVAGAYRALGHLARSLPAWSANVLTAHPQFQRLFGREADKKRKLYNGRILCYFYMYPGQRGPRPPASATLPDLAD